MLRLEAREQSSRLLAYCTPLIAVVLTLASGFLLFWFMGRDPLMALRTFFITPLGSAYGIAELLVKATPIALCAVGLAMGFRANIWNIGAEGQLTLGAIVGAIVALAGYQVDAWWLLPAVLLAGIAGGMAWAAIPAFLRTRFHTNEILVSLMLVYVAQLLLSYMVNGPLRNPEGFNFPESRLFHEAATIPVLWQGTRLHAGAILALLAALLCWLLMARHIVGFQVRVSGLAPAAANYAGFRANTVIWFVLLLSGGLAGLAGIIEVAGPLRQITPVISPGYGFTAIIVAFLGRLHPIGVLFAALLMALTYIGGETAQIRLGMPNAITGVFQGMLLFYLLASDVLISYRIRFRR